MTTHVGSLARPDALVPILKARDRGQPYDRETYAKLVRDAVADAVRRQTAAGVDVVTDGEQGKASFFGYIVERFNGFARKPAPVQVSYLAYPGTSGLGTMDWLVTDPHLDPPNVSEALHTEQLLRLPECYWCYRAPTEAIEPGEQRLLQGCGNGQM